MGINFRTESFRDDFTFRNSPEHIRRFPFPFHEDSYMYAVNIEPHVPGPKGSVLENLIDVDEHYVSEMADRALVLAEDPLRCQSLPHMTLAGWDLLELLMTEQAKGYPEHFSLTRDGDNWHWINRPLGIDQKFVFGDLTTLPDGPMEYITRQSQGDFCILDQRDGNLWMDAGIVTTHADWSLDFDIGMNFFEWHAPVPLAHEKGIFDRALKFLLRHYPLRGPVHARRKIFDERLPRSERERTERGWHVQYVGIAPERLAGWKRHELVAWHPLTFHTEFVVERLSGLGLVD